MPFKDSTEDNWGLEVGPVVLVVPGLTLEGDYMTVVLETTDAINAGTITPPAGWTLEESGSMPLDDTGATSPPAIWIYTKIASADDETGAGTDTYTWTWSGGEEQAGICLLYDPVTWGQFASDNAGGDGDRTTGDAPSVTTTSNNEIVLHCLYLDRNLISGLPSGTLRHNDKFGPDSNAGAGLAVVEETFPTPGATGAKTFTHNLKENAAFTFSLIDSGGGDGATFLPAFSDQQSAIF